MHTDTALVLTLLVLGYAVVSALVSRWYVAPALIFIALGMVLGPSGLHLIDASPQAGSFTVLAQLALTVILFNQAARLDVLRVIRRGHVTFRLLFIGIPLTLILGAVTATLLLPVLPWWEAVCLAAIVAPTEVALIDALLDDERIPERVRHALSVESGFYDGFALAALLAAVALASASNDAHPGRWAWFAFRTEIVSLVAGAVIGVVAGWAIATSWKRDWMSDTWAQLATRGGGPALLRDGGAVARQRVRRRLRRRAGLRDGRAPLRGAGADAGLRRGRSAAGADGVRDVRGVRGQRGLAVRRAGGWCCSRCWPCSRCAWSRC